MESIALSNLCSEIVLPTAADIMSVQPLSQSNSRIYHQKAVRAGIQPWLNGYLDRTDYVPAYSIDSHYPFVIRHTSVDKDYETEDIKQSNTLAQYIQSERFVKYGKSDKRVQKHIKKMEHIIDSWPDLLL